MRRKVQVITLLATLFVAGITSTFNTPHITYQAEATQYRRFSNIRELLSLLKRGSFNYKRMLAAYDEGALSFSPRNESGWEKRTIRYNDNALDSSGRATEVYPPYEFWVNMEWARRQ